MDEVWVRDSVRLSIPRDQQQLLPYLGYKVVVFSSSVRIQPALSDSYESFLGFS